MQDHHSFNDNPMLVPSKVSFTEFSGTYPQVNVYVSDCSFRAQSIPAQEWWLQMATAVSHAVPRGPLEGSWSTFLCPPSVLS